LSVKARMEKTEHTIRHFKRTGFEVDTSRAVAKDKAVVDVNHMATTVNKNVSIMPSQ
jgi:hypothetical protein